MLNCTDTWTILPKADHVAQKGYGWANQNFWALRAFSANDLRIGSAFVGQDAKCLIGALNRACRNIQDMPANFIKWPGTDRPVFQCAYQTQRPATNFFIDREHLLQFGTFSIPASLWQCMGQFACWLEPAVVNEWIVLLDRYNQRYEKQTYAEAMKWSEGIRDTRLARECAADLRIARRAQGDSLNCVWSNRKLADEFEIDHCFPWSRWFNNDLWNLMPASRTVNNAKREKLPSAGIMHSSKKRIMDWWEAGYCSRNLQERFFTEAEAALPLVDRQEFSLDSVFEAAMHQRARLKANQQLVEWTFKQ